MNPPLRPCPFCDRDLIIYGDEASHPDVNDCPLDGFTFRREDDFSIIWNTRAHPTPDREVIQKALWSLRKAAIGSCQCLTKSPDPQYHKDDCRYRFIDEAITALEAALNTTEKERQG